MKEENGKLILSISLLCSGRNKEEMIKTLDSLMTIRNRILSEIVIVDTGCGPDTKQLLPKYADKLVQFKWCDDFAKARNAGLDKCSGEWFMFIDDDEWFENTDNLVNFFDSGEYKKYDKAEYRIRNYLRLDGSRYEDFWSGRLAKLTDDSRFHGEVHEYLTPGGIKAKRINCLVHHYGYAYADREGVFHKARRNVPLLLDMMEKEPDNLIWGVQLVQEYRNINDYSGMKTLCKVTLDKIQKIDNPNANWSRSHFYEGTILAALNSYRYDEAVIDTENFLADKRNSRKCNAGLYFYAMEAYWGKKDYQRTFVYSKKYIDEYDYFNSIEDVSIDDLTFICGNIFRKLNVQKAVCFAIFSGVSIGDLSALYDYFDRFDLDDKSELVITFCEAMTEAFADYAFDSRFVEYAKKICRHTNTLAFCIKDTEKTEKSNTKKFSNLVRIYGKTDSEDDPYMIYLRLLYACRYDRNLLEDIYKEIFDCVIDFFDMDEKVWNIAEETNIDLVSMFREIPFLRWKRGVDLFMEKKFSANPDLVSYISKIIADDQDIRFQYFRLKEEEMRLSVAEGKSDIGGDISAYCTDCVSFYLKIYQPELFTGDLTVLPPECQFAMNFIKTATNENNYSTIDFMKEMEKCAAMYEPFTGAMKSYINSIGQKKRTELLSRLQNGD